MQLCPQQKAAALLTRTHHFNYSHGRLSHCIHMYIHTHIHTCIHIRIYTYMEGNKQTKQYKSALNTWNSPFGLMEKPHDNFAVD